MRLMMRCVDSDTVMVVGLGDGAVPRPPEGSAIDALGVPAAADTLAVLGRGVGGAAQAELSRRAGVAAFGGAANSDEVGDFACVAPPDTRSVPRPTGMLRLEVSTVLASTMSRRLVTMIPASLRVRPKSDCFVKRTIGMCRKPRSTIC